MLLQILNGTDLELTISDDLHDPPAACCGNHTDWNSAIRGEERQRERVGAEVDLTSRERRIVVARIGEEHGFDIEAIFLKAATLLAKEERCHVQSHQMTGFHFRKRLCLPRSAQAQCQ